MEFEEDLIKFCKRYRCFWDKNDPEYKDIRKRDKLWAQLSNEINVPPERLKGRWRSLRNTFRIEYGKEKTNEGRETRWKYYDMMAFLKTVNLKNRNPADEIPNFKFCNLTRISCSEPNSSEMPSNDPTDIKSDNNYIEEFLSTYGADNPVEEANFPHAKRKKIMPTASNNDISSAKLKSFLCEATKAINSQSDNCEISQFFQCLATKVKNENLNRDETDEFQEVMLHWVNEKLAEIRQSRKTD